MANLSESHSLRTEDKTKKDTYSTPKVQPKVYRPFYRMVRQSGHRRRVYRVIPLRKQRTLLPQQSNK